MYFIVHTVPGALQQFVVFSHFVILIRLYTLSFHHIASCGVYVEAPRAPYCQTVLALAFVLKNIKIFPIPSFWAHTKIIIWGGLCCLGCNNDKIPLSYPWILHFLSWSRAPKQEPRNYIFTIAPKYYQSAKNQSAEMTIEQKKI